MVEFLDSVIQDSILGEVMGRSDSHAILTVRC
jgi:hypothetical protein